MKQSSVSKPQISALAVEMRALMPKIIAVELWRSNRQYSAQPPSNLTLIHSASVSSWLLLLAGTGKKNTARHQSTSVDLPVNPAVGIILSLIANSIIWDKMNSLIIRPIIKWSVLCTFLFLFSCQVGQFTDGKCLQKLVIMFPFLFWISPITFLYYCYLDYWQMLIRQWYKA